ncbi:MAG: histidine phosphatase family protein [Muribaculaceae bacterium]|nr:histidine phosphatase family protein [Muribaculaceae bacterium]
MKKLFISLLLLGAATTSFAQDAKEEIFADLNKAGSVYYAYPVSTPQHVTAPPKGFEPFYVSHYGRHGSRYLINDKDYKDMLDLMQKAHDAGVLTPLGEDVLSRIKKVWVNAEGHGGDLSPLGSRQANGIAHRLYDAYPQIFKNGGRVTARSTVSLRCSLTMSAFCEGLKEKNPALVVTRESSNKHMSYLNYHSQESSDFNSEKGPWREEYRKFEEKHVNGDRLAATLFNSKEYINKNVNPRKLAWGFYWFAVDMQDMEEEVSFYDLFTKQELFDIYQVFNYRFYVQDANYAGGRGMSFENVHPLLRNVIESAEAAIAGKGDVATLRFGHDGNLIPFAGVLGLKDCYNSVMDPNEFYQAFRSHYIAPMGGNVQIIFFRNKKGEVIVKFLLNEQETSIPALKTDMAPFYRWSDVKNYYETEVLK